MTNPSLVIKADPQSLDQALAADMPVLMWFSANGESPMTDVSKALEAASKDYASRLKVFTVDTAKYPDLKERFQVGKQPLLVGWHQGEQVKRRPRPWAADVQSIADALAKLAPVIKREKQESDSSEEQKEKQPVTMHDKPVHVTDDTFENEVINSELPVLIDFWAEWCGPCRMVAPTLEKLAGEYVGKVKIAKVDVDNNPGLAQAFRIMSIPTLMFIKQGKIVGQTAGALPEATLRDALEQLIALEVPSDN